MRLTRDGVLFVVGLLGVLHETLLRDVDRIGLLTVFAAMIGLPTFLRADEQRRERGPGE